MKGPALGLALAAACTVADARDDFVIFEPRSLSLDANITIPAGPNPGGDAVTIDIAVVYTRRYREQLESNGRYIADYILRTFDEVNRYLANTGLLTRIEVSGLLEWNLGTGGDLIADHDRMIGFMENQTNNRNSFAADLVQLWEVPEPGLDDPAICGWGQVIGPNRVISTSGFGYSAVLQGRRGTAYAGCYADATPEGFARIVGHELGHNLGSTHARGEGTGEGAFAFSYGKLCGAPINSFPVGTLMSISGYALDFFSTPARLADGEACGTPEGQAGAADNRETFTRTASYVAGLRNTVGPQNAVTAVVPSDIGEQNGNLPVILTRTNPTGSASLEMLVFGQTAVNGRDFNAPVRQTLSFAAGQAAMTVQIPLVNDGVTEGAESLLIFLQRPVNLSIQGDRAFRVDIQDGAVSGIADLIADTIDMLPSTGSGDPSSNGPPGVSDGSTTGSGGSGGGDGGGGGGAPGALLFWLLLAGPARRRRR